VRALLGLEPLAAGEVLFGGIPLSQCDTRTFRRAVQPVFQDPRSSLNPRLTVGRIVAEPLECLGIDGDHALHVREVLADVALDASFAGRYPHELSGGQRQRVAIARALAPSPQILIADEPVSALDVLIRDEIVALIDDLIARRNLSLVLVSHDLAVVARLCTEIAVMRDGRVVESGPIERVVGSPVDDFTRRIVALATSGSR
jgi:peptide/nickel transport system ATP-binding protein